MPLSSAIFSFFPSYTIFLSPETLFLPFYPQLNYFFCTLDALNINPQKKNSQEESVLRASRSSRSSRGKILKRKVSQEPQEERSSRSSRGVLYFACRITLLSSPQIQAFLTEFPFVLPALANIASGHWTKFYQITALCNVCLG